MAPVCPASCPIYAPCEPSVSGGRCANLSLAFVNPASMGVYDAGATIPVQVTATLVDGGAHSVLVPLTSSFGTNAAITSSTSSSLPLPAVAGTYRLTAGWDGGPSTNVTVFATSCVATCQPWQQCGATTDGGVCSSLGLVLAWTSPDAGLAFNTASVTGRLSVTRSGGPVPPTLTSVPLFGQTMNFGAQGPLSALTGSAGVFTGSLPLFQGDGFKTFTAGWPDGGPTATLSIERDTTPPLVTLLILPRPPALPDPDPLEPTAWKKNESALVRVDVDGGRPAVVSDLSVVDSGVNIVSVAPGQCGCASALCRCFEVPLRFARELRGSGPRPDVSLAVAPIPDAVGNLSPIVGGEFPVTRFLWSRQVGGNPALAVSETGLLLATTNSGGNGLTAIAPDGGTLWVWASGSQVPLPRPVVGAAHAYVTTRDTMGLTAITKVSLSTGSTTTNFCAEDESANFAPPMALATTIPGFEIPVAFRQKTLKLGLPVCPTSEPGGPFDFAAPTAIVTETDPGGDITLFATHISTNQRLRYDGVSIADAGLLPGAGALVMATGHVGGSTFSNFYFAPSTPGASTVSFANQTSSSARRLVGASGVLSWDGTSFTTCPFDASFVFALPCQTTNFVNLNSPLRDWVKTPGGFVALTETAGLVEISDTGFVRRVGDDATDFVIDVPRTASGAKACFGAGFGRAYVSEQAFGTVTAWLIEAQGLDGTAHWPAPRHDPANSNNVGRSLAPWSCP